MEIRYFRSFMEVAARGHVGRAARALGIAQPSLSYQIARLEEAMGAKLFVRSVQGMELTAAGQMLLDEARPILRRIDGLGARIRAAEQGKVGTLRIGLVPGALLSGVASRTIRGYRAHYPKVTLRVHSLLHVHLVRMLHERELDLAVFGSPLGDAMLIGAPIAREPFLVALPAEHRLAKKRILHYRELRGETLVALARELAPSLFSNVLQVCAKHGFVPSAIEEAAGEEAVIGLVAAGVGIAIIPDSWRAFGIPGFVTRKLSPAGAGATLRLFRRADDDSALVRAFIDCAMTKLRPAGTE